MLEDDLWLANARAANAAAAALAEAAGPERLVYPVEANELFVRMTADEAAALRAQGYDFYDWGPGEVRFVTSWDQDMDAVGAARRRDPSPVNRASDPSDDADRRVDHHPVHHLHRRVGIDLDRHPRPARHGPAAMVGRLSLHHRRRRHGAGRQMEGPVAEDRPRRADRRAGARDHPVQRQLQQRLSGRAVHHLGRGGDGVRAAADPQQPARLGLPRPEAERPVPLGGAGRGCRRRPAVRP